MPLICGTTHRLKYHMQKSKVRVCSLAFQVKPSLHWKIVSACSLPWSLAKLTHSQLICVSGNAVKAGAHAHDDAECRQSQMREAGSLRLIWELHTLTILTWSMVVEVITGHMSNNQQTISDARLWKNLTTLLGTVLSWKVKIRLLELAPEAGGSKDTGILNSLHILAEDCMYVDLHKNLLTSLPV